MADKDAVVHIGENSPEQVAYKMAERILISVEGRSLKDLSRQEYLDAVVECIRALKGNPNWKI